MATPKKQPKKLASKDCCPSSPPKQGDKFVCDNCGMELVCSASCGCADCECVCLGCCGIPMTKVN
jgi:hypothetical protein